jgi:predicted GIY-YIG superfamily endonuclease
MFVVYAIESCSSGRVYIGQTGDLCERLNAHNNGHVQSTADDKPWRFIALQEFGTRDEARWCERELKKSRGRRLKWIERYRV